jgi:hypothetical protein
MIQLQRIIYVISTTLLLFAFQNCSPPSKSQGSSSAALSSIVEGDLDPSALSAQGTGHGYDGKLYVHVDRSRLCPDNTHMTSSILIQADRSGLMDRKDCQYIAPVVVPAAQMTAGTGAADTMTFEGKTFIVDPCKNRTEPQVGTVCGNGAVYSGTIVYEQGIGRKHTMLTPSGCTNSTHPLCDGSVDSLTLRWGASGTPTGITGELSGQVNTTALAAYADAEAARYCENLVYAGFTDWYLPASEEWYLLNQRRGRLSGFATGTSTRYWSSTEADSANAWAFQITNSKSSVPKTGARLVRCMRRY